MRVFFLVLCSIFFSCTSTNIVYDSAISLSEYGINNFFDTIPTGDELIFIGVAEASIFKQNAIQAALEDAARKVSFFDSVGGEIASHRSIGPLVGNAFKNPRALRASEDYKKYIADLKFDSEKDVLEINQAVFVRTRYKTQQAPHIVYTYSPQDKKPEWIENPPVEVSGYMCSVGIADKQLRYKDMVITSYEDAIFSILKSQLIQVENIRTVTGNTLNSSSLQYSSGTVHGFYVLDTWTDQKTQVVWTLAIAKYCEMDLKQLGED